MSFQKQNATAETQRRGEKRGEKSMKFFSVFSASSSAISSPPGLHLICFAFTFGLAIIAGCINGPMHPAATQPATISDTATTQPVYWYAMPSPGTCVYDSF